MALDDHSLIKRVLRKDDRHAFAELVRRHQSQVRLSLRQLVGWDDGLAEDLAQETFLKAYLALAQFKAESKFSTWLYRIAYNLFISHTRKRREEVTDEVPESADHSQSDVNAAVGLKQDVETAMKTLPDEQRAVVHFCCQRGYSNQETADIMGIPLGTVKSHVLRGKARLKELLSGWQEEQAYEQA